MKLHRASGTWEPQDSYEKHLSVVALKGPSALHGQEEIRERKFVTVEQAGGGSVKYVEVYLHTSLWGREGSKDTVSGVVLVRSSTYWVFRLHFLSWSLFSEAYFFFPKTFFFNILEKLLHT